MTSAIKPLTVFLGSLLGLLTLVPGVEAKPLGYIGELIELFPSSGSFGTILVDEPFVQNWSWEETDLFFEENCLTLSTQWSLTGLSGAQLTNQTIHNIVLQWTPNSSQVGKHTFYVRVDWTGLCNGSEATDSRRGEFTVEVVFACDSVIEWIGSPYPSSFFRGNPQKGDFTLAIEDGSGEARGATVRVEVFNSKGQRVYTNDLGMLIASLKLSSPWEHRGKVLWEGRNDSGNLVAVGKYFVRLRATPDSQACATVTSGTRQVTVW